MLALKPLYVVPDAFLDASETQTRSNTTKLRDIGTGVALVVAFQLTGEGDKLDIALWFTEVARNFSSNIEEAGSNTGANIVDSTDLRVIKEPTVETSNILNMDKVALLLSSFDSSVFTEELNGFEGLALFVELGDSARQRIIVLLTRSVDFEEAQSCNLGRARISVSDNKVIEQHLRVAEDVQWSFLGVSLAEDGTVAVDSSG